jgi:hypothetical protein
VGPLASFRETLGSQGTEFREAGTQLVTRHLEEREEEKGINIENRSTIEKDGEIVK